MWISKFDTISWKKKQKNRFAENITNISSTIIENLFEKANIDRCFSEKAYYLNSQHNGFISKQRQVTALVKATSFLRKSQKIEKIEASRLLHCSQKAFDFINQKRSLFKMEAHSVKDTPISERLWKVVLSVSRANNFQLRFYFFTRGNDDFLISNFVQVFPKNHLSSFCVSLPTLTELCEWSGRNRQSKKVIGHSNPSWCKIKSAKFPRSCCLGNGTFLLLTLRLHRKEKLVKKQKRRGTGALTKVCSCTVQHWLVSALSLL